MFPYIPKERFAMINKKFIAQNLLLLFLIFSLCIVTNLPFATAAPEMLEAEGKYTIGESESMDVGIEKARERALRAAKDKSSDLLIKTSSVMENNTLVQDKIEVYSAGILKLEGDPIITKDFSQDSDAIKITYKIKFWVDPEEFEKKFANVSTEKFEDQIRMNRDQKSYKEKNETEIIGLREKYKNTKDSNERQKVVAEIKRNEEKFTASQLYQRGAECYSKGELANAVNFYNQAIAMDSQYAAPLTGLGWIYNDQEQYAKAIEYFQKSIALYDGFAVPYNGLSYAYNYSNEFNKAIEYANKAVQLDPKYAAAWNNIGFAYNNLGNYDKAIENYNKAMAMAPNDEVPFANAGNVYYKQKNFTKALEYYQKSININSNHSGVWYNLGNIYGQKGEINKAIDSYKKATALDPQNVRAWIMAGYLNNQQKNFEEAKRCFKKALKINPNSASAWAGLGFAYDGAEDYSNSLEAYKKAVELEPTNENYKKNLETAKQKL